MVDSKQQWKAWLYLSPAIVLLLIFTVWPIINTVRLSLLEGYNSMAAIGGAQFNIGFGNFLEVMEFPDFLTCLKNTILLCVLTVPLSTILALLIAVALNSIKFLQKSLQTIFFLPYVTNSIAIGMVFAAMFSMIGNAYGFADEKIMTAGIINNVIEFFGHSAVNIIVFLGNTIVSTVECFGSIINSVIVRFGGDAVNFVELFGSITNSIIMFLGGEAVNWLDIGSHFEGINFRVNWMNAGSSYEANIFVMVVYIVWNALPFKILVLLGGLQSINKQYYDAAKVDGTPRHRVFTHITVPLLSPMLAYVVITGFIGGFKEYTSIVGIFGENMGPPDDGGRLNTMVGFVYDALEANNQGRASAAALILFFIILVVTVINNWVSSKRVHY